MNNITEHKWSEDSRIMSAEVNSNDELVLNIANDIGCETESKPDKSDAIAIANHFKIIGFGYQRKILKDLIDWVDAEEPDNETTKRAIQLTIDNWFTL